MDKNHNIVFFFPARIVGGVQQIFTTLAEEFSSYDNLNVYVVDFEGGYMASTLSKKVRIKLLPYFDGEKTHIPQNSTVIVQANNLFNVNNYINLHLDTKLFGWNLHPLNCAVFPEILPKKLRYNLRVVKILNQIINRKSLKIRRNNLCSLIEKGAIHFMDNSNLRTTKELLLLDHINNDFLPLPLLNLYNENRWAFNRKTDAIGLDLCWVGRVDILFKFEILYKLICDVNNSGMKGITFHVIGTGQGLNKLKRIISKGKIENINVNFLGDLNISKLENYLSNEVDVLFAMGNSALIGANLGVPTINLDASYSKVKEYKYRWIYDSVGYSVGYILDYTGLPYENKLDITDVLNDTLQSEVILSNSERCRKYIIENYKANYSDILKLIEKSNFTYEMALNNNLFYKPLIFDLKLKFKALLLRK